MSARPVLTLGKGTGEIPPNEVAANNRASLPSVPRGTDGEEKGEATEKVGQQLGIGGRTVPEVPKVPPVPADAKVSYCNWRVGSNRPTRRYLSADEALTEAKRIATVSPGATVYTYKLRVIGTNGEGVL